jgi:hypothetical protein
MRRKRVAEQKFGIGIEKYFSGQTGDPHESPDFIDKTHRKKFSKNSCG